MKNIFSFNITFLLFFTLLKSFISLGPKIISVDEINNDDFNPFNSFLNFDRIAKELMSILSSFIIIFYLNCL